MEQLLTITEAANLAGVSEKTLRRAINGGCKSFRLNALPHRANQPIMIARSDLEKYIESRQPSVVQPTSSPGPETLRTRIDELEATIQRMQRESTADTAYMYNRLDHHSQQITDTTIYISKVQNRMDALEQRLTDLHQDNQALRDRIAALESVQDKPQGPVPTLAEEEKSDLVQPTFDDLSMPDFAKPWQSRYFAKATRKDMWGSVELRPYQGAETQGLYQIYSSNGKVNPRGSIGRDQKFRGEILERDLKNYVLSVMSAHGWTEKTTEWGTVYQQPDMD